MAASLCALLLAYQDLKNRWVSLYMLLVLGGVGLVWALYVQGMSALPTIGMNLGFVVLMLGGVWSYFRLRYGRIPFWDVQLGWGDVVFWLVLCPWFDVGGYVLFFCGSLILVLLIVGLWQWKRSASAPFKIPLAGLLALIWIPSWLAYQFLQPQIKLLWLTGLQ